MSLIQQKIENLLGGVSQRPPTQRLPSQAEEQINAISTLAEGVRRRPPSKYIGKLTSDVTGWDDAFVHIINRDEDERYHVVVADGTIKIFDAVNSVEVPVVTPNGTAYLEEINGKGFRAVTIGDTTVIVNRGMATKRGTKTAPAAVNQALIYVKQADFSTAYTATIDDITVAIRTVDMDTPSSRQGISTEAVANDLLTELMNTSLVDDFTFTLTGSTIHVIRTDGEDFTLAVADGLADTGLVGIKGELQVFDNLPARAINGFVVEITGDIDTAKDNYFVQYDDGGNPGKPGVWRECPKPGSFLNFDETTMPHRLTLRGADQPPGVGIKDLPHDGPPLTWASIAPSVPTPDVVNWSSMEPEWPTMHLDGTSVAAHQHFGSILIAPSDSPYVVVKYVMSGITLLSPDTVVYAKMNVNGVLVDSQRYQNVLGGAVAPVNPDHPFFPNSLVATNVTAGDIVTTYIEYASGADPVDGHLAQLIYDTPRLYGEVTHKLTVLPKHRNPGTGTQVANYPIGAALTALFFDGPPVRDITFTVTNVGTSTPTAIATGLKDAINADGTYTATSSGNVITIHSTGPFPLVGTEIGYPALTFHNDTLTLTVDELVGTTFKNITDGSTGTVTGNTANTITVGSLSGGLANIFKDGDICGVSVVFVDPDVGTHYVFDPIPWNERVAGSVDVVTFPSFMDLPIADVFFYQNRLGFLCKENVVFSSAGNLYNLFRYTATDFRPDDVIDIRSAHADVTIFDSAFQWSGGLYVKSNNVWFRVSGEPAITPTTIRLDPVGRYPSSKDPRPVVSGDRAYFTRAKSGNTQVFEVSLTNSGTTSQAVDITRDIPSYIKGKPVAMVGDSAEGFIALLTDDAGQKNLYVYSSPVIEDTSISSYTQEHVQFESWGRWEFPAGTRILGLDMADGVLGFIRKHSDGAYFEQIDLDLTPIQVESVAYLDRRLDAAAAVYTAMGDYTTWTIPYAVPTDGSEGDVVVARTDDFTVYTVTRPTTTTVRVTGHGDLSAVSVYVGQSYQYQYTPTQLFIRGQQETAETAGRLQIRWVDIYYRASTNITVTISPKGRPDVVYTLDVDGPQDGHLHIPVLCQNKDVDITITNATTGPCAISQMDWEGWFTSRGRRI